MIRILNEIQSYLFSEEYIIDTAHHYRIELTSSGPSNLESSFTSNEYSSCNFFINILFASSSSIVGSGGGGRGGEKHPSVSISLRT